VVVHFDDIGGILDYHSLIFTLYIQTIFDFWLCNRYVSWLSGFQIHYV